MKSYVFYINNLGSGGAQKQLVEIGNFLVEKYPVTIVTYSDDNHFENKLNSDIERIHIDTNILKRLIGFRRLLTEKHNSIHISLLDAPNLILFLVRFTTSRSISIYLSERSDFRSKGLSYRLARVFMYSFSNVIVNSIHAYESILKSTLITQKKLHYIPNFVDPSDFQLRSLDGLSYRACIVGSVNPTKNGEFIIKLAPALKALGIGIDWIGRKYFDCSTGEEYFRKLKCMDSENSVKFLGERSEMKDVYADYDIILMFSTIEGMPNVLIEAMATGCIPVAANRLDFPLFVDESTGFLVNEDVNEVCLAIRSFYELDNDSRVKMMKAARRKVLEKLSVVNTLKLYEIL